MKKFLSVFLPIFLIFCTTCTFAKTYKAVNASYSILVNGVECEFANPVLTVNGKTYLPLTEIAKALSVEVVWNEDERQVEITNNTFEDESDEDSDENEEIEEAEEKYWWEWDYGNNWWDEPEEETSEENTLNDSTNSLSINLKWYFDEDSYVGVDYSNQEEHEEQQTPTSSTSSQKFVGSKSGSKYHLSTCHWADKIKSANKVYFSSKSDAEKEDYEPCSTCIK